MCKYIGVKELCLCWLHCSKETHIHHTRRHGSETSITHHVLHDVVGMSFMLSRYQSSIDDCIILWGSRNRVLVDCNVQSYSYIIYHTWRHGLATFIIHYALLPSYGDEFHHLKASKINLWMYKYMGVKELCPCRLQCSVS